MRSFITKNSSSFNPIRLEVFKHMFASIPEEMGAVLRKASYSPNIKERRDYSCAIFNSLGEMISQAAHIPVHLGSMPLSVTSALQAIDTLSPGDIILLNDPYKGGTHLPDITLINPVFINDKLIGFVANRAHHADVGGMTPGSMPIAREIYQEGIIIPPIKISSEGHINIDILNLISANVRTPQERLGDLYAQIAANDRGVKRLSEMVTHYGIAEINSYMSYLLAYSETLVRERLKRIPEGTYTFEDYLDDDGINSQPILIRVSISINQDSAIVDFKGSAPQQPGGVNAVYAITLSAVYYVFRCLIGFEAPNNSGCLAPIEVIAQPGSIVNAVHPSAVAGGNVETSQRIVDVLLGALNKAIPGAIPAAGQGTMNNITIGGWDPMKKKSFAYYETIGGGMGASSNGDGVSAIHTHMTNTLNTPIEALEYAYPLRILRYEIRDGSGGDGLHHGGDGIRRDIQVLYNSQITLLSDRRIYPPYGLNGGLPGKVGDNSLLSNGISTKLSGKGSYHLQAGDIVSIKTPGGGGYGLPVDDS